MENFFGIYFRQVDQKQKKTMGKLVPQIYNFNKIHIFKAVF